MFDSLKPTHRAEEKLNIPISAEQSFSGSLKKNNWPFILTAVLLLATVLILALSFNWLKSNLFSGKKSIGDNNIATDTPRLVNNLLSEMGSSTDTSSVKIDDKLKVEYLSFSDFYTAPESEPEYSAPQLNLPMSVKNETSNYYEIARKFNLDGALSSLNNYGFAVIDNPWPKEALDFYSVYGRLSDKQAPLLISLDFITYYYQNNLKKAYQDIEESVFYDNLWLITKDLYVVAKTRYEAHLTQSSGRSDQVLEAERLEVAYLAVTLELLKPTAKQINSDKNSFVADKFDSQDAAYFDFSLPGYLQDDVSQELKLIREAKIKSARSPVLFYERDYSIFSVPAEYQSSARLNNFYLTSRWLNSVFPINYISEDCPNCLLDQEDWQVNMIAAAFLAHDFGANPLIKQRWARIYKIISFFKGLRADYNYVNYRDELVKLFGDDFEPAELFSLSNENRLENINSWRQALLKLEFPEIAGGFSRHDPLQASRAGFKVMADYFWPNDYIFSYLSYPNIGAYNNSKFSASNVTGCRTDGGNYRCQGFSLDILALTSDVPVDNPYWLENTNYNSYSEKLTSLRNDLNNTNIWHLNNYWSTLHLIKLGLGSLAVGSPTFMQSRDFKTAKLKSAVSYWINLQLPVDKLKAVNKNNSLISGSNSGADVYIEPGLAQVNEMIASVEMIIKMAQALNLGEEANLVIANFQDLNQKLKTIREIMRKELKGETLSSDDRDFIMSFASAYSLEQLGDKNLIIGQTSKRPIREDLSTLKLLLTVNYLGDKKFISIGPVFSYQEKR